jgi:hypothetical protein
VITRTLAALALCLGLTSFGAFAAKDHTEAAQKHYTCSYCNTLAEPGSCCWKIAGCETVDRAGAKVCQQKAKPKSKPLEPYKPMGLSKKSTKKEPTFTCDYCNSIKQTKSCCAKVAGCHLVEHEGADICSKK